MSGRTRRLLGAAAAVIAAAIAVWVYQLRVEPIAEGASGRAQVAPNRPITWASGVDVAQRPAGKRPPNIVLIVADDLGWNDLTFGGGGVAGRTVPTPRIDSIAEAGVHFARAYAAHATCAPARAALLSGRYPTRFGFEFQPARAGFGGVLGLIADGKPDSLRPAIVNDQTSSIPFEQMGMPASEVTLAELLARRGYHNVHIGKWHLGRTNGMAAHDQGFHESLRLQSGFYLPEDDPAVVNARRSFDPTDRLLWPALRFSVSFNGGEPFEPARYLTDYFTDEAIRAIEANQDRRFFLYLAHLAPHIPLQAARADYEALSHIEDHGERVYAAMVRSLDRGVGRVLDALRERGLEENTLVLFTSDNGAAHYVGLPDLNAPFRGWKMSFFEGGIHVPFFAKWPARLGAGERFESPVHHVDVYATAAAAAGIPIPRDRPMDGVDLIPHLLGKATSPPHRELFWRADGYATALVDGWKLQVSDPPGKTWLFDLKEDPTEQRNLAEAHPERVAALWAALAAHAAEQAAPAWPSPVTVPVAVDKTLAAPDAADDEYVYWAN